MTTLKDIAQLAGVSGATVSNVLRNRGFVGVETAARVRQAAERLGYRPNPFAQALAQGRAPTIAMVFSNIANPFYAQFALEAERAARRREHFLLVCHASNADGTLDTSYLGAVAGRLSGGVLVLGSDIGHANLLSALPPGVPTVLSLWEDADEYPSLPCVTVDFTEAGRLAAQHLHALGHRRIAILVGGSERRAAHGARFAGALAFLQDQGLAANAIVFADDTIPGGFRAADRLFGGQAPPTAILAMNDLLAIGAVQAAVEHRLTVADQVSVMGITDIWMAAEMRPALTTVDIDTAHIAEASVNLLLDLVADPNNGPPDALRIVGRPRLVRRATTGPPPG